MDRELNIIAISDIHVGCPRLNSKLLHDRFIKYLYPQITKDIDILFICGDFFDTLLNLNSQASLESLEIISELKQLCRENDCDLRVLRGTFTHDRNQPQHFVNGDDPNDTSVKLYDKLALEYNEKTGLNILYIPDNLPNVDICKDARELLDAHHVDRADILVHHGYFKHMLPPSIREPHGCLDVEAVSKLVKGCVLNGHVHLTSIYKNVISIGSFDRLTHGEEGPKGFYKIRIDKDDVYHFNFIENKEANKFLTLDLRAFGDMASEAVEFFNKKWTELVKTFRPNEPVRLRFLSDIPSVVEGCTQVAKEHWPDVGIDKAVVTKREQILENINMSTDELPVITPDNLCELALPIIQKRVPSITIDDIRSVITACSA